MAEKKKEVTPVENPLLETVKYRVPRRGGEKVLFVSVNQHNWELPRGKTVEIPRYIAEVLERSELQDELTEDLISRAEAEAEAKYRSV